VAERCGIVGIGQTRHQAARKDVSMVGLVREAAERALEDAELRWKDIDAVVIGKAPDMFEGVMMPELFLNDALGGAYKPMLRVHTAGSVGGSTGIVAASLVQAGVHDRVLTVAFEKQSESNAMWRSRSRCPSRWRWWRAPAASSRRWCAATCAAPARPRTPASAWR
jgi:acetyl-CoA C-acetyltransferase